MNQSGQSRGTLLVAVGLILMGCGGSTREHDGDESAAGTGGSVVDPVAQGGGGSGGVSNGSAGAPAPHGPPSCSSPELDPTTGYVQCGEGYVHRASKVACEGSGGAIAIDPDLAGAGAGDERVPTQSPQATPCGADASVCQKFPLGFCDTRGMRYCSSGCFTDADCGTLGTICECGHPESPSGGACVYSLDCTTDSDCQPGFKCASLGGGGGRRSFACQTPQDQCVTDKDCEYHCVIAPGGVFRTCGISGTE